MNLKILALFIITNIASIFLSFFMPSSFPLDFINPILFFIFFPIITNVFLLLFLKKNNYNYTLGLFFIIISYSLTFFIFKWLVHEAFKSFSPM